MCQFHLSTKVFTKVRRLRSSVLSNGETRASRVVGTRQIQLQCTVVPSWQSSAVSRIGTRAPNQQVALDMTCGRPSGHRPAQRTDHKRPGLEALHAKGKVSQIWGWHSTISVNMLYSWYLWTTFLVTWRSCAFAHPPICTGCGIVVSGLLSAWL